MSNPPDANYRYWQQRGAVWPERYQERKQWQVFYHLQEFYLLDYFLNTRPARILEFGCGYGRHLRNLLPVEGLEVFGHDQSPTMLERMADWADPAWMESHVTLGGPVARLPYEDDFFDVVYTAEVLVHVRPEDLASVLAELVRVSRWQVLHLETAPEAELDPDTHGGCWKHDLAAAYRDLGHQIEELSQCYHMHQPSRLLLDPQRAPYTMPGPALERLALMEAQLQPTIDRGLKAEKVVENKNEQLDELRDHLRSKRFQVENLERIQQNARVRMERLERERDELAEESGRRIADLEGLNREHLARIRELGEEAGLVKQELQRAVKRLRSRTFNLDKAPDSPPGQAGWAQVKAGLIQDKMVALIDRYDSQRLHLEHMTADRDRYRDRYSALLRTLDRLASQGGN